MTSKSMRNKMKKTFVCTLSAAVLMSSAAVPAFAADEEVVFTTDDAEDSAEETQTDEVEVEENSDDTADFETAEEADTEEAADVEEAFDDADTEALSDGESVNNEYKVSFTSYDGKYKVDDVVKDGIQMNIQDVPEHQNIGHLEVEGFDGKVAWLLSQYETKKHVDSTESNIWPGLYSGDLAVKGVGEATIVAWDESTLSHTVDSQDVPNQKSRELARFKVTITSEKVAELRLLANGNTINNNTLSVNGSEWFELTPQTRTEGSNEWKTVPVSSVQFPTSTEDKNYESLVTNKEAKYHAKGLGKDFDLTVTGYDQSYTLHVSSSYVPVKAIKPSVSGTVVVYPSDYTKGDGSQNILGTVITRDVFNGSVDVTPSYASYADRWTMTSSDEDVVEYNAGNGTVGIMPKKVGEATLTVKSEDPGLSTQVSGSTTVKFVYADEVAVEEFNKVMKTIPAVENVTKADEETVKEAVFIYDNMSAANKALVSKDSVDRLTKSAAKLNGNIKSEDGKTEVVQKPEVKDDVTTTVKPQKKTVALKKLTAAVKKNWTVKKGKKVTLKVKKAPAKATGTVKWTSSNKKVATVSAKGVVKTKKKGTAVITAKVGNKKVKFKITVK